MGPSSYHVLFRMDDAGFGLYHSLRTTIYGGPTLFVDGFLLSYAAVVLLQVAIPVDLHFAAWATAMLKFG